MKFRKKPVTIEAEQFTDENKNRCFNFVRCNCVADRDGNGLPTLRIQTLEGEMTASLGDWIIKGVKGEFYPCRPDIFAATYEPAEDIANVADQTVDRSNANGVTQSGPAESVLLGGAAPTCDADGIRDTERAHRPLSAENQALTRERK